MRLSALVLLAMLCAGCSSMTNDAVIAETKKCEAAGMKPEIVREGWRFTIIRVECVPK